MTIRPYTPADRPAVVALHERHDAARNADGKGFWFADPDDPIHFSTLLVEDDGRLVAAMTGRACVEAFLMLDPQWGSPRERFELIERLIEEGGRIAFDMGYREVHIGTAIKRYAQRLSHLAHMHIEGRYRLILNLFGKYGAAEQREVA